MLIICIILCSSCLVPVPTSWPSFEWCACISLSFWLIFKCKLWKCVTLHTTERQMGRTTVSYSWHLHLWIKLCYVAIAVWLNCMDFHECGKVNHGDNSLTMTSYRLCLKCYTVGKVQKPSITKHEAYFVFIFEIRWTVQFLWRAGFSVLIACNDLILLHEETNSFYFHVSHRWYFYYLFIILILWFLIIPFISLPYQSLVIIHIVSFLWVVFL
jgi:hypothetical protein